MKKLKKDLNLKIEKSILKDFFLIDVIEKKKLESFNEFKNENIDRNIMKKRCLKIAI